MDKNQYSTQSLALAAAIQLASKSKLLLVDRSTPRASFVFSQSDDLEQLISKFWQNSLFVDALSYFESLRIVKSRLYERSSQ